MLQTKPEHIRLRIEKQKSKTHCLRFNISIQSLMIYCTKFLAFALAFRVANRRTV